MSDLICRQAAIDICDNVIDLFRGQFGAGVLVAIKESIEELPSAEPEPIKINIEDFNKEDWERLKKEWGNTPITVLPAQPEIVRCKDCDWWTKQEDSLQGRCALLQMYPTGGWFCGNARRREVTT